MEYRYLESEKRTCLLFFKQSALYLTIKNYPLLSASGVVNDFRNPQTGETIGRHFVDAIFSFWNSKLLLL